MRVALLLHACDAGLLLPLRTAQRVHAICLCSHASPWVTACPPVQMSPNAALPRFRVVILTSKRQFQGACHSRPLALEVLSPNPNPGLGRPLGAARAAPDLARSRAPSCALLFSNASAVRAARLAQPFAPPSQGWRQQQRNAAHTHTHWNTNVPVPGRSTDGSLYEDKPASSARGNTVKRHPEPRSTLLHCRVRASAGSGSASGRQQHQSPSARLDCCSRASLPGRHQQSILHQAACQPPAAPAACGCFNTNQGTGCAAREPEGDEASLRGDAGGCGCRCT